jgi:ABC-type branched-subunit amino acid transport system substrate-binding protein
VSTSAVRRGPGVLLCGVLVVAVCVLAACGGSSSSSSGGGSVGGGSSSSGSSAGGSSGGGSSSSGSPIKVSWVGVKSSQVASFPETFAGAEAAVSSINARGGVNGHRIQLITCDSAFDPNKEAACLKQAVADKVVAATGQVFFPGDVVKILAPAKVPWFGGTGSIPDEAASPDSIPIAEQDSEDYGVGYALAKAGAAKRVVAIYDSSVAPSSAGIAHINAWLQRAGFPKMIPVVAANTTADFSAAAAAMVAKHPTGMTMLMPQQDTPKILVAVRKAGYTGPVAQVSLSLTPTSLKAAGSAANGMLVASAQAPLADTSNPAVAAFLADMKRYQPGAEIDNFSEQAYVIEQLLAKVAARVSGPVTASSFAAAANGVTSPIDIGLIPPWKGAGASPVELYPGESRYKSYGVQEGVVKNGVIVGVGGFVDPVAKLQAFAK